MLQINFFLNNIKIKIDINYIILTFYIYIYSFDKL